MMVVDGVEVLDVREAAAYVDRTAETIRRWVWSGRLSAVRRGNRLLVARQDLDALQRPSVPEPLSLAAWSAAIPRATGTRPASAGSAGALVVEDRWADDHGR